MINVHKPFWAAIAVFMSLNMTIMAFAKKDLASIHADVVRKYAGVEHISTSELVSVMESGAILFDVREEAEFAVSHIDGAIQISPKMRKKEFLAEYGTLLDGKTVVFYCSVGHRSSKMAKRVLSDLKPLGAVAVYNLEGGVFKWHNEERPLVQDNMPTDYVHPYNKSWGVYVERQAFVRYE